MADANPRVVITGMGAISALGHTAAANWAAARDGMGGIEICQVDAGQGKWTSSAADSRNDFSQMRMLGFDVVRLVIHWEEVEPTPGVYDQRFIDRVSQIVDWAQEQGIYTLIDFHEDNYGDVPRTETDTLSHSSCGSRTRSRSKDAGASWPR